MPKESYGERYVFLPREALLRFEEIVLVAEASAGLGVRKIRITGGEPLLRRGLVELVRLLKGIPGIEDIALTTNGVLLPELAGPLREAGLDRVTVSLDSLDSETFGAVNGVGVAPEAVLAGVASAEAAGFSQMKVNVVVQRGVNDHEAGAIVDYFRGRGHVVRFIEYMDVGTLNGWEREGVVPSRELLGRLQERFALRPAAPHYRGEVAERHVFADGVGEVGFISSVTQPFCGDCSRLRLSADGTLYTCLFAASGVDIRGPLRGGADLAAVRDIIADTWRRRGDRYSELRAAQGRQPEKVEMYHIGG